MKKAIRIIWKEKAEMVISVFFIAVITGLMTPLVIQYEEQAVDSISLFLKGSSSARDVLSPFLLLTGAYICTYMLPVLAELFYEKLRMRADLVFHRKIIDKMQTVRYQYTEDRDVMDLYARIDKNMDEKLGELAPNLCGLTSAMIGVAGFFSIICSVSLFCALVFLVLFVFLLFFADRSAKNFYQLNRQFSETERRVVYLDSVENTRPYAHEKKLFGYTDYINRKRSDYLMGQRNVMRRYDYRFGLTFSMIDTAGYICTIVMMLAMLAYMARGRISIGLFIAASHAAVNLNLTTQNKIRAVFSRLMEQRRFWKEYWEFLALPDQDHAGDGKAGGGDAGFESLEFRDVTFQYPGGPKVLDHISFRLEKGKHYALVGENGAGKSTIVKLMLGLYEVSAGEILLNGHPLSEYGRQELYCVYAAVFQDFSRYYISLEENISFGDSRHPDRLEKALEEADLKDPGRFRDGLKTRLGEIYEDGTNLSGGEWQRIAFARALYREAPVILLDEPTSALDPVAENEIYNQFERIVEGKTTVFITHRLASTKMADEILVLKDGRVAEQGTHAALMERQGLYAKMYDSQKKWYREVQA